MRNEPFDDALSSDKLKALMFADDSVAVVERSVSVVRTMGAPPLCAGALMLSELLRHDFKMGAAILNQCCDDMAAFGVAVDELAGEASENSGSLVAPLCKMVTHAHSISQELGHDYTGTEHIVLAIADSATGRLQQILDKHKLTYSRLLESLSSLLG